jgi:hypothetical protein
LLRLVKPLIIAMSVGPAIAATAVAGDRMNSFTRSEPGGQKHWERQATTKSPPAAPLDQVVEAVDGAESSHGSDMAMWRPDPSGPQGPMQVTEAAASDVGGGDRFDVTQNRAIGRAYLSQLFWRYRSWPDAIAAYNWGVGNMDAWVKAGRPADKFLVGVAGYLRRVLHESGLCVGAAAEARRSPGGNAPDPLMSVACSAGDMSGGSGDFAFGSSRFHKKLDAGLRLALDRAAHSP